MSSAGTGERHCLRIVVAKKSKRCLVHDVELPYFRARWQRSADPLFSFEDLRPYIKLLGKNWWMMLAFAGLGYVAAVGDHRVGHSPRQINLIIKTRVPVDAMLGGRTGVRGFNCPTTKFRPTAHTSLIRFGGTRHRQNWRPWTITWWDASKKCCGRIRSHRG